MCSQGIIQTDSTPMLVYTLHHCMKCNLWCLRRGKHLYIKNKFTNPKTQIYLKNTFTNSKTFHMMFQKTNLTNKTKKTLNGKGLSEMPEVTQG